MKLREIRETRAMAFVRCFFRCYLVGACFNNRGYQNIGLAYVMQPGLEAIHRDAAELRTARKRYLSFFNTHLFWVPCLVGVFLHMELMIHEGKMAPEVLTKVKDTTSYTLSAIGDSVFSGSVLVLWSLATVNLLLLGLHSAALFVGAGMFALLQVFRFYTFWRGIKNGFAFVQHLRRWRLIDLGTVIKYLSAVLVAALWYNIWPETALWHHWIGGCALLGVGAFLVRWTSLPRGVALGAAVFFTLVLIKIFPGFFG